MNRREKLLEGIDVRASAGLEIGALCRPLVKPGEGPIAFVDHCTTAELRAKYAGDPNVDADAIVDVSYVWGDNSLREAVGPGVRFDYVLASHVVEHTPNLIEWLREVAEVLRTGGVCCLAVPDKRYTFDIGRPVTPVSVMIDDFVERRRRPSVRAIFDHVANTRDVDPAAAWCDDARPARFRLHCSPADAYARAVRAHEAREYHDVHCYALTPASFLEALRVIMQLDLVPMRVRQFHETAVGDVEFFVQLEKLDPALSRDERRRLQEASLPALAEGEGGPEVDALRSALRMRDEALERMSRSASWRITAPLRALRRAAARASRAFSGPQR